MPKELPPFLKVGTEWIGLEMISEPDVVLTFKGYAPILQVREISTGSEYRFYISAKSLAKSLEELRRHNGGVFKGIQFRVRKESMDKMAKYEVDASADSQKRPERHIDTNDGFQERRKSSANIKKKLEDVLLN